MSITKGFKQLLNVKTVVPDSKAILSLPQGKGRLLDFVGNSDQRPTSVWNDPVNPVPGTAITKDHFEDYLDLRKAENPGKQGEDNYMPYTEMYREYSDKWGVPLLEAPGKGPIAVEINNKWYRAKSAGRVHKTGEFAGKPKTQVHERSQRHKDLKSSGKARTSRINIQGFDPNKNGREAFRSLEIQRRVNNKRDGFKGGTEGWVIEHNILQSSRYFDVHKHKYNSDPWNTFLWKEPKKLNYKEKVEKYLKALKGEPLVSKIDLETNEMILIDIDLDLEIGRFPVFQNGYRDIIQNIIKARKAVNELPIG